MRKFLTGCVLVLLSVSPMHMYGAQNDEYTSESIFRALSDSVMELGSHRGKKELDLTQSLEPSKKKRKKFFKRLLRELIVTTLNFALETVVRSGGKRSVGMLDETLVQLCEDLRMVLLADQQISQIPIPDFLYNIFSSDDEQTRRKALSDVFANKTDFNNLISDLFDTIFRYYSEKIDDLHEYFGLRVIDSFKGMAGEEGGLAERIDEYDSCAQVAIVTVKRHNEDGAVAPNRGVSSVLFSWPAIWCLVKITADIGELVLQKKTDKKPENKTKFLEKVVILVKDFRDFVESDDLSDSFEKISKCIAQVKRAVKDEELRAVLQPILESSRDGVAFLEDLFSSIALYTRGKLTDIFAQLFCNMYQIGESGE